jgi:hypothetical protein
MAMFHNFAQILKDEQKVRHEFIFCSLLFVKLG